MLHALSLYTMVQVFDKLKLAPISKTKPGGNLKYDSVSRPKSKKKTAQLLTEFGLVKDKNFINQSNL